MWNYYIDMELLWVVTLRTSTLEDKLQISGPQVGSQAIIKVHMQHDVFPLPEPFRQ
jgi:hypothetical protein